ncbi:hypothetical protein MTP99_004833 [Tenebrio molitor]|nr:hypothetical protein MTP99_004833 [Tenebrio molitor]
MPNKGEPTAPVQTEAPTLRNPEVDRVTVRVPPFWSNEPALWFSQLESQLALANVTADTTKFHYVVSNLDFRNTQVVRDNLQTLPRTDKYEALKTALISRLSSSEEQRILNSQTSKELAQLRKEVAELRKACNRQQRRNQSPAPQDKPENTICWYHNRFKGKATKCTQPCSYQAEN